MATYRLGTLINAVKHWYIHAIVGVILILVGIYVFSVPLISYLVLATLFSASFAVTGILQIIFSISNRHELHSWGWHLAGGILYTMLGIVLIARPEISILTLPLVVGFFLLFQSVHAMGWSFDLKNLGYSSWGWITFLSAIGVIFSIILVTNPYFAGLSLVIWTGMTFIVAGFACIMFSIGLKKVKNLPGKLSDNLKKRIDMLQQEYDSEIKKAS